jgi:hypothetical protein
LRMSKPAHMFSNWVNMSVNCPAWHSLRTHSRFYNRFRSPNFTVTFEKPIFTDKGKHHFLTWDMVATLLLSQCLAANTWGKSTQITKLNYTRVIKIGVRNEDPNRIQTSTTNLHMALAAVATKHTGKSTEGISLHLALCSPRSATESESEYFTTGGLPPISSSWRQTLETHNQYFFQLNACGYSPYVTSSLTRGWVCCLELLLVLASAAILGSESRGTHYHDHILLSQIRDSLNLEGQVPVFISPGNRAARS